MKLKFMMAILMLLLINLSVQQYGDYVPFIASEAQLWARCLYTKNPDTLRNQKCDEARLPANLKCACAQLAGQRVTKDNWNVIYSIYTQILSLVSYRQVSMPNGQTLKYIAISFDPSLVFRHLQIDASLLLTTMPLCPECKVHTGFKYAYDSVRFQIRRQVSSLRKRFRYAKILITGTSLGAALATLCATDLSVQFNINPEDFIVYTFGQPRVGNKPYIDFINSKMIVYRVNNFLDPVPHLPNGIHFNETTKLKSYFHPGVQVWYSKVNQTTLNCNISSKRPTERPFLCSGDNDQCSNSALALRNKFHLIPHLAYHCTGIGRSTTPIKNYRSFGYKRSNLSASEEQLRDLQFLRSMAEKKVDAEIEENAWFNDINLIDRSFTLQAESKEESQL